MDAGFGLLASPDPLERDEVACPALATWLETGRLDDRLPMIGDRAVRLFAAPESYTRSFAALVLTEMLLRDAGRASGSGVISAGLAGRGESRTWAGEHDLRGWIHALAHGPEVAARLAPHPALGQSELTGVLTVLTARRQTVQVSPHLFEDDRMALAVCPVLSRPEVTAADLHGWRPWKGSGSWSMPSPAGWRRPLPCRWPAAC